MLYRQASIRPVSQKRIELPEPGYVAGVPLPIEAEVQVLVAAAVVVVVAAYTEGLAVVTVVVAAAAAASSAELVVQLVAAAVGLLAPSVLV